MTKTSLSFLLLLAFCSYLAVAFSPAGSLQKLVVVGSIPSSRNEISHGLQAASTMDESTSSSQPPSPQPIESHLIVGCFGRLSDKSFVVSPSDLQGTAASGYEFGVLESGRPKWICSYTSRTGATQGGGADMTHVPTWCSVLFDENASTLTKKRLTAVLQSEDTKFEMPLGASPMAKTKAALPFSDDDCKQVMNRLWEVLGGDSSKDDSELSEQDVTEGLAAVATEFGSKSDSMTYSAFEKAMKA